MEDDVAPRLARPLVFVAKAWYEALRPCTVRARRWEEANELAQLAATQRVQVGEGRNLEKDIENIEIELNRRLFGLFLEFFMIFAMRFGDFKSYFKGL